MDIKSICNVIKRTIDSKLRPPVKNINPYLLWCSLFKRPGLSVSRSFGNTVQILAESGIPTGPCPDGQPNYTLKFLFSVTSEHFRALREDAVVQSGSSPGVTSAVQVGPSGTGSGTIINSIKTWGAVQ